MIPSRWNVKKILLALAGALFVVFLIFIVREKISSREAFAASVSSRSVGSGAQSKGLATPPEPVKKDDILVVLKSEARLVGQVDENPERTKEHLSEIAAGLSHQDLAVLSGVALDRIVDADERFLAAYLMAENRTADPYAALTRVATAPIDRGLNERIRDFEIQVRAQAVEGLGKLRNDTRAEWALKGVAAKSREAFLRDRAQRSLYEWRTGNPVEEQDQQALEKLVGGAG